MMDSMQAAHIVSALNSLAHSMERIANALDPATGGAAQVAVDINQPLTTCEGFGGGPVPEELYEGDLA